MKLSNLIWIEKHSRSDRINILEFLTCDPAFLSRVVNRQSLAHIGQTNSADLSSDLSWSVQLQKGNIVCHSKRFLVRFVHNDSRHSEILFTTNLTIFEMSSHSKKKIAKNNKCRRRLPRLFYLRSLIGGGHQPYS